MKSKEELGHKEDITKLRHQYVQMVPSKVITDQKIKLVQYREQQAQNTLFKYREIM